MKNLEPNFESFPAGIATTQDTNQNVIYPNFGTSLKSVTSTESFSSISQTTPLRMFSNITANLPSVQINDCSANPIEEGFEEFLGHFTDENDSRKYFRMATELGNSDEINLEVAIEDIRVYKNELMNSIKTIDFKVAFPLLCKSLFRFVKRRIEPNLDFKRLIVRLL